VSKSVAGESPPLAVRWSVPRAFRRAQGCNAFRQQLHGRRFLIHLATIILLLIPVLFTSRNWSHQRDSRGQSRSPGKRRAKLDVLWLSKHGGKEEEHTPAIALSSSNWSAGYLWRWRSLDTSCYGRKAIAYTSDNDVEQGSRVSLVELITRYFGACWRRWTDVEGKMEDREVIKPLLAAVRGW